MTARTNLPRLIITFCLFLSFVRATNIGLFYPPDEFQLAQINYLPQTLMNFTLLLGITAYFFIKNDYRFFRDKLSHAMWVVLLGLVALSLALSVNKIESIKFVVAVLVISTPSLLYLREYGAEALLKALGIFTVAMAFINMAYVLALPEYGIMIGHHLGRWRGMFEHKNVSGPFFAIGFFIILHQLLNKRTIWALIQIAAMGICFAFVLKASSSTAMVAFAALAVFYPFALFAYRVKPGQRIALLLIGVAAIVAVFVTLGPYVMDMFFSLTGKDATLTGRTGIWRVVIDLVNGRPLYGFGPGLSERPEFMQRIQGDVGWEAKSTHNSFLDLLISFGYPLAALIVFFIFKTWISSFSDTVVTRTSLKLHAIASSFVFAALIVGFAGASVLVSRSIFWVVMVIGLSILSDIRNRGGTCADYTT